MEDKKPVHAPSHLVPQSQVFKRRLYFEGVPAPMGAAYVMVPLLLSLLVEEGALLSDLIGPFKAGGLLQQPPVEIVMAVLVTTSLLMVSSLPTLSSKMLKRERDDSHFKTSLVDTRKNPLGRWVKAAAAVP